MRDVCSYRLCTLDPQIKLGGAGKIVAIDESLFSHKQKVNLMKWLLLTHRGRPAQQDVWVFGMCDISTNPALGYMEIVTARDSATLLPIIQAHVNPGTVIWSYCWAAYNSIIALPSVQAHDTVNHSIEFVAPSGVHTNHIESYWNRAKIKLKRMRGCHRSQLPSYLDEFMWRERYGKNDILTNIYRDIALWYPV